MGPFNLSLKLVVLVNELVVHNYFNQCFLFKVTSFHVKLTTSILFKKRNKIETYSNRKKASFVNLEMTHSALT